MAQEPASPTVRLESALDGSGLRLRAVAPDSAAGRAIFYRGARLAGTAPLQAGEASLRTAPPPTGAQVYRVRVGRKTSAPAVIRPHPLSPATLAPAGRLDPGAPAALVQSANLDGDDFADLVFAGPDGISVRTRTGTRSWRIGGAVTALALADLDGDGLLDILATNGQGSLSVFRGARNGDFLPPFEYSGENAALLLAVADWNVDGSPDAATAGPDGRSVTVWENRGDGTLHAGPRLTLSAAPTALAPGDFNGDGIPDLAAATEDGIELFTGNGAGHLESNPLLALTGNARLLLAEDFDADGATDLAVAGASGIRLLLGSAKGWTENPPHPQRAAALAWADVDGDGLGDIVLTDGAALSWMRGNGRGGFDPALHIAAVAGTELLVGDWDRNGRADVAVVSESGLELFAGQASLPVNAGPVDSAAAKTSPTREAAIAPRGATAQTIAFGAVSGLRMTGQSLTVSAAATSGLAVTLASTTASVCTIAGGTVRALTAGTCAIQATQAGNATYSAATPVTLNITISAATPAGAPVAASGSPYATGDGPSAVAVADFNADGRPDMALPNCNSNNVTILLGNASGSFTAAAGSPIAAGSCAADAKTGDFNADGKPDLAVLNTSAGTVTVLLGNGSGGFTAASGSPFRVSPDLTGALAVGDFNGDARLDLISANDFYGSVSLLLGNGSGGFTAAAGSPFSIGGWLLGIAAGDFNRDGNLDYAATDSNGNRLMIRLGNGAGGFSTPAGSPYTVGSIPIGVAAADLDRDGIPDLAVANRGGNSVSVLLGDGTGGFSAGPGSPVAVGTNPRSVAAVDFDGDARLDLVTANDNSDNLTILRGNGSGGFNAASNSPIAVGTDPYWVAAADFNADGKVDLAAANRGADTVTVLLGSGQPNHTLSFGAASGLRFAGHLLTVSASSSFYLPVTLTSTTPSVCTIAGGVVQTLGAGTCTIQASQAGNANVPAAANVTQSFTITRTAAAGNFVAASGSPVAVGNNPNAVKVGDFNRDGNLDFASANEGADTVSVFLGNGSGGFTAAAGSPFTTGSLPSSLVVADLNGDTFLDIAVANRYTHNVTVLLGNGSGGFSPARRSPFSTGPSTSPIDIVAGDFNRDGIVDLATAHLQMTALLDGGVGIHIGDGNGGFTSSTLYITTSRAPKSLAAGDLNGDGNVDLMVGTTSCLTFVMSGNGSGQFWLGNVALYAEKAVALGDWTGDGKLDAVAACDLGGGEDSLYSGVGNGLGGMTNRGANFAGPYALAMGDFRGIGRLDAMVSRSGSNELALVVGIAPFGVVDRMEPLQSWFVGSGSRGLAAGDFNNDGRLDLASADWASHTVPVLLGVLPQTITFGPAPSPAYFGTTVTVTATGGASGNPVTFTSGTPTVCTTSGTNGASVTLLAIGNCLITANQAGNSGYSAAAPVTQLFPVTPAPQIITFGAAPSPATFNTTVTVSATGGGSGNPVTFTTATPSFCTTSGTHGASVALIAVGTCTIRANQAGNTNYSAATAVTQSFAVTQASQTITFSPAPSPAVFNTTVTVSATGGLSGNPVTFASLTAAVCTTSGTNGASVALIAAGTCTIRANQAGNANYSAAAAVTQTFTVTQASQTITFGAAPTGAFFGATVSVSATGGASGNPVTFTSATAGVCTTSGTNGASVTLVGVGTCTVTANQAGTANYGAAATVNQSFAVAQAGQAIVFGAAPSGARFGGSVTVSATGGGSGNPVTFTSLTTGVCTTSGTNGATVALIGVGTCTIRANQAGSVTYTTAAPVDQSFSVAQAVQTLAFGAISGPRFVHHLLTIAASSSAGLPVTVTSTTPAVCRFSGGLAYTAAAGTCTLRATQVGNANVAAATPVEQSVTIAQTRYADGVTLPAGSPISTTPPYTVVVDDFNRDGNPDIAAAGTATTISVLLGSGSGGFTAAPSIANKAGGQFMKMVSGDFNADGSPDLAVANPPTSDISVFLGNGSGGFSHAPGSPFAGGQNNRRLATGDFNNDGRLDLVTLATGVSRLRLFLGNGAGGFTLSSSVDIADTSGTGIAAADLNGDGKLDVAVGTGAYSLRVYAGDGAGAFAPASTPGFAAEGTVVIADFNGDGKFDIGTRRQVIDEIYGTPVNRLAALLGDGAGGIASGSYNTTSVKELAAGDFNGDGAVDLASIDAGQPNIRVDSGNGAGQFSTTVTATVGSGQDLAAADFNGDGRLDLVSAEASNSRVLVLLGSGLQSQTIQWSGVTGSAVYNGTVTANATGGASGNPVTFTSGSPAICTTSGTNGATVTLIATGFCIVTANQAGNAYFSAATAVSYGFTVTQASQSISFGSAPSPAVAGTAVTVSATGGASGNPVTFTSATPAVCSVSGATVTLTAAGTCTITANQAGNANYSAATAVNQSFTVTQGTQAIAFGPAPSPAPYGTNVTVTATGGASGNPVTFTSATTAVCTTSGTNGSTVALIAVGTCTITANQAGNASYAAAPAVTQSFTVTQATQTITFGAAPSPAVFNTTVTVSATGGGSGNPVTFTTATPAVCTVSGASVTLVAVGTCSITANQAGNTNYSAAPAVSQSFTVTQATQTIVFGPAPPTAAVGGTVTVSATGGGSGNPVTFSSSTPSVCSSSGAVVALLAAGTCSIVANQAGNANYAAASAVTQSFAVGRATPVVTWNPPSAITYGQTLSAAQLNATANVPGSFTYNPPAGTRLNAGAGQTLSVAFTPSDAANYNAASGSTVLTVLRAAASVTPNPASKVFGAADPPLTGTLAGFLPGDNVAATYTRAPGATVAGSPYVITATLTPTAALANYNVTYNTAALIIVKATPVLTWPAPAPITFGTALGGAQLNATASVPGVFAYTPGAGTVLPAGAGQTLACAFTPADTGNYNTASATTTITVNPAGTTATPPALVVTRQLSRNANGVVIALTIANNGGTAASNVTVSRVVVGTLSAAPLPQNAGTIAPGATARVTVTVPGTVGASGAASSLSVSGTYTGGTFTSSARITLP